MNQKYEITDIVHPQYPWLHRIRALRDVREDVHAGDLGGEIEVHEHAVILPGVVIDNPTIDVLHIRPDEIVVERKFKRESPVITPPPEYQPHPRASKKRSRGEER